MWTYLSYPSCLYRQVVVDLARTSYFICDHQQSGCDPCCYEKQRNSCKRLVAALCQVYESEAGDEPEAGPNVSRDGSSRRGTLRDNRYKRRVSAAFLCRLLHTRPH